VIKNGGGAGIFFVLKYHISAFLVGRSNLRSAFDLANCSDSNAKSSMSLSCASVKKTGVTYFEYFATNNFYSEDSSLPLQGLLYIPLGSYIHLKLIRTRMNEK
jgi:hypothetical protein